ncbi:MAG: inositol monophosphatase [Gammaproteobacteria bacterium]|uniref:Inositol-1-monophosphatase n=1 Tax=OM182 bacterium MED-G24 TaxID=1986255 RepID=A0A2A5WT11_9GAMM|nr:inositol monophosphatase [Gammaproteobacteria bacterium]PDH39403.1 MAG: inositol monophosphatase [OM182 bacterium MED-G24]RPG24423.1 MAG: inositol monophosphatase [Gammaproteobacteria bacterium TMED50]
MQPMASMALRAARIAAQHIMRGFDRPDLIKLSEKSHNDPVTNLDKDAERIIIEELSAIYPDHGFVGEEKTSEIDRPDAEYQWIIDPIDGTYNFVRNIPHFCISIGCMKNGRLEHGVIVDPVRDEEFVTSRGSGAQLNNKRMRVSGLEVLDGSAVITSLAGTDHDQAMIGAHQNLIGSLIGAGARPRTTGSAALDLAWVAAGRVDGFCERTLNLWDMAAGLLMVTEAGGMIGDYEGGANPMKTGAVVAGNPKVFRLLTQKIKAAGF